MLTMLPPLVSGYFSARKEHVRELDENKSALEAATGCARLRGMDTTPPLPSIFDEIDEAAEERAWAEGEGDADADAGRLIPHGEVVQWVKSWGTENELPPPKIPGE